MRKELARFIGKSPLVRRTRMHRQVELVSSKKDDEIRKLHVRAEEWALEVRKLRLEIQRIKEYEKWLALNYPTSDIIAEQRSIASSFGYRPLISIILPVYNTEPAHLSACIDSVIQQSYTNWQLCIVDDASTYKETIACLDTYEKKDSRIKVRHATINGHISIASNAAIDMAEGEFIALLDHDDLLWPNALFENVSLLQKEADLDFIYSDEDKIDADGLLHFAPYFKPGWSPHLLECVNYITHFAVMRASLVREIGGFNKNMVGAQDWDLFLRLSEHTQKIRHIPTILYSWRAHGRSTALSGQAKGYAQASQQTALQEHFTRTKGDYKVEIENNHNNNFWYPKYSIKGRPLVSIVIPTKDKVEYLRRCISSITDQTSYQKCEIIIVDTGSIEPETKAYYEYLKKEFNPKKLVIKNWRHQPFNYSDACNFGAKHANGEFLVMLNNDTEVMTETWIEDMLGYAQQPEAGAVGVRLMYPNSQVQHAGVTVGIGSREPVAGHIGINTDYPTEDFLTNMYVNTIRDTTAVTAACLMISSEKFWKVKGFDPTLRVTFNDVDFCLKVHKAGYQNVYLPFVELIHHESVSVGRVNKNRDMTELNRSAKLIRSRWKGIIDNDPYYNKNFYIPSSNFGLAIYD